MKPQQRGALRRRLRRAVRDAGGVLAVSEKTGIEHGRILRVLSYNFRPSDGDILILAACMFGIELTTIVQPPTSWWFSRGGDA